MKVFQRQRHLSIRQLKPKAFNVIDILNASLDKVYEKSDERILLSTGLLLNLEKVGISSLGELLWIMRGDQSLISDFGQKRTNEILKVFKKLKIDLN